MVALAANATDAPIKYEWKNYSIKLETEDKMPTYDEPTAPVDTRMTRKRYLELTILANELTKWMAKNGIQQHEGCVLRRLTEELWGMGK